MALPINIKELLNGQVIEWERLEFKRDWNPVPVLRTLCAFANDINNWGGGYIIIGVEEREGRPVLPPEGVAPERMDGIQKELTNLCQRLQPNYLPIAQPYVVQNKHILVIWAPAGDMRPYTAPDGLNKGAQRFSYIRSAASTIKAKGENLRRLQELTARIPFDDRVQQQATLKDLSLGLIRDFLNEVDSELFDQSATMPFADLCRQMAIAKGPDEQLRPVNAGLMFFNEEPERFFSRAWIEVVIREDEAGKRFREKYFKGPLHIQLRNALSYIRNNIIEERVQKVSGRAEADRYFNYPYDAVEEALANAVYHKSYELGKPIEVQIWPDKIEVLSFPGPVPPVNARILADNRRIVARDYRNRRVGDFLKELHLTEGRGTGIPTMRRVMERNGSPLPQLETDEQCTYFLTTLPVHPIFEGDQVNDQVNDQVSDQVDPLVFKVIGICKTPSSRAEILEQLGFKNHFDNYKKYILPALENGWIEMTVPDKPRSRNQKYRVTELGRAVFSGWNRAKT